MSTLFVGGSQSIRVNLATISIGRKASRCISENRRKMTDLLAAGVNLCDLMGEGWEGRTLQARRQVCNPTTCSVRASKWG